MNNPSNCGIFTICAAVFLSLIASPLLAQIHDGKPLELSGYSVSQAYDIQDGQPLDLDDPAILQLLYRIKKTSPKSRGDYSNYSKDVTWEQLSTQPQDYRLWIFDRHVRLKKITKHRFAGAEKDDEVKGLFLCHCENEHQQTLTVLSRSAPRSLPINTALDEPIRLTGFLFACATTKNQNEQSATDELAAQAPNEDDASAQQAKQSPVFIVDRIAWFPEAVVENRSNASQVALAQAGVDVGLLDLVRENNGRKLGAEDSEAFFQMIAGVNSFAQTPELTGRIGFVNMMQDAKSNFGNAARIKGVVRSCSEINITNPDIVKRIGASKYYQLMMFPNLDGGKIVVKNKSGEDLEYRRFPITVCCLELPAGASPTSVERKPFLVDGFFFRFWKYQSDKTDEAGTSGQVSPLIIAKNLTPIASQEGRLNFILLCFVSALIAGFTALIWWYRTADRRDPSPGQKIIESLPDQLDVTGIEQ